VLEGYFGPAGSLAVRVIERSLSRVTDCTVAISERQRADLVSRFKVARADRTVVIPLGLNLGDLLALERDASPGADDPAQINKVTIGFVGRLVPIKRVDRLLRAVARARGTVPGLDLLIVGDGPERRSLEALAAELGIAAAVEFRGWQEDLATIYAGLDALAITSANEGTPVALIEAMAAGVPVLSTAVGGVPDVVQHEVTGLLAAETPEAIAGALVRIATDRPAARQRAMRARAFVRERFRDEVLSERMSTLYRELIDRKRSRGAAISGKLPQSK
jgi:glycosyltransferase involved in cell wall biosynthesis